MVEIHVLPDIDIALYYILYFFGFSLNEIHRTFTHTIFIPLILFLIGMLFYYNKNKKAGITFSLLSAGCLLHLILDLLILRKLSLFYPISTLPLGLGLMKYLPREMQEIILPTIDAICIFIWVILFETKPKKANKNLYKGIPPKHN